MPRSFFLYFRIMKRNQLLLSSAILSTLLSCSAPEISKFKLEFVETGMTGTLRGLDVVDPNTVWISGTHGQFCTSSDKGVTWHQGVVPGADSLDFRDVQGFSAQEALLMSAGPGAASRIYKTTDAGRTWTLCFTNPDSLGFFDGMDFANRKEGILFSDPIDDRPNLLFTTDGGTTWKRVPPDMLPQIAEGEYAFAASGTSIQYDSSDGIWLVTGGTAARIWFTPALGKKWSVWMSPTVQGNPTQGLFSVAPRTAIRVLAVGGDYVETQQSGKNVVKQTRVGEVSWELPGGAGNVPFMECVKWMNNSSLIACGPPGIWFSSDFGTSWSEFSSEGFHTLDVSESGRLVWLGGNGGQVARIAW